MVQIAMDLGNTRLKTGIFLNHKLVQVLILDHGVLHEGESREALSAFISDAGRLEQDSVSPVSLIYSSVLQHQTDFVQWLQSISSLYIFNDQLLLPFENCYLSPSSLGSDRLAAVAGALELFSGQPVLVVNAGTAITYEYINERAQYLGGAISPGLQMRYKALHTFTSRLPLVEINEKLPDLTGRNTLSSMQSGVELGALFEVQQMITSYLDLEGSRLRICLSGGDSKTFVSRMKSSIFAGQLVWQPDLVLIGLNKILTFNNA